MSSPRTSPDEKICEDFVKVECDERYESMMNGSALRKRTYRCAELESISPPVSSLDSFRNGQHPSTTVYRSESDSDSQYSPRYSPLRGDLSGYDYASGYCRNGTSPALLVEEGSSVIRNGGSAMYQMGGADERTAAFVQAQQRTLPVPIKYVSELSANALNGLTHDSLVSLTKQLNSADILQKLYTDCSPFSSFPYVGHGGSLYHHQHANPTSTSVPARVAAPPPPPPASSGGVSSGPAALANVFGDLHSQRLIPPRKRFLAGIRNTPEGSGPNTISPHSDTNHSISPPLQLPRYPSPSPAAAADQSHASSGSGDDKKPSGSRPISAQEKDAAYWERRRKNNEAAKRSRDIRRQKEEQIAAQAAMLSAENVQLKAQIDVLKNQLALVQSMMLNGAAAHRQS